MFRNGLDADSRVGTKRLSHFFVQKADELLRLRGAGFPLYTRVYVLRIFPEDCNVYVFRMFQGSGHASEVSHGSDASVKIQVMTDGNVKAADSASHWRGQRTLDCDFEIFDGIEGVLREPLAESIVTLFAGEYFPPDQAPLSPVCGRHRLVDDFAHGLRDIRAHPVSFYEWDYRFVRDLYAVRATSNRFSFFGWQVFSEFKSFKSRHPNPLPLLFAPRLYVAQAPACEDDFNVFTGQGRSDRNRRPLCLVFECQGVIFAEA